MKLLTLPILVFIASSTYAKNAVIFFADDAGQTDFGIYGNKVIKTPNIDNLARMGTTFTNAFTSVSSCSPSRAALLTGMPGHQNGMYGLQHGSSHFRSFDHIKSLPLLLKHHNKHIKTGIIGKKHVGPDSVYHFDFDHSENWTQTGRNITHMKLLMQKFLDHRKHDQDFFLYIGLMDPHRDHKLGSFAEKFGDGKPGHGIIPDWKPIYYKPEDVVVPYHVPNTHAARVELSKQYTSISRLDQGVGLFVKELEERNLLNDTLILFSADNGIPFPAAKTNVYDAGVREPLLMYVPQKHHKEQKKVVDEMTSLLDVTPTVLDWFGYHVPKELTGRSLLNYIKPGKTIDRTAIFGSHSFHGVIMDYPMRYIRTQKYKLIHNINYQAPYKIGNGIFNTATFEDLLYRHHNNLTTHWYTNLKDYYFRAEWELFDMEQDPKELNNLAGKPEFKETFQKMKHELKAWLKETHDPWICAPHSMKVGSGCKHLYNDDFGL